MDSLHVIHVDMDAFYASIEQRDHPEYRNKPIVVGGNPNGRGVVSTASYQARKFGVRSAMSCKKALELCPNLIFVPVNMEKYKKVSRQIYKIFSRYTSIIESISIDEAFLDVGTANAIEIGKMIKEDIKKELSLTASVGVSYNRFLAKLASDMEKPDGFTVITREMAKKILPTLPIRKIWGVGEKTEKQLNDIGIFTVKDLLNYDHEFLLKNWGRRGYELIQLARGIDPTPIQSKQEAKSFGEETTLERDTRDLNLLKKYLKLFSNEIEKRLNKNKIKCRTITVKVKYYNFKNITRSTTLSEPVYSSKHIYEEAERLLKHRVNLSIPVRLIGLQVSNFIYPDEPVQLSMNSWIEFDSDGL